MGVEEKRFFPFGEGHLFLYLENGGNGVAYPFDLLFCFEKMQGRGKEEDFET